MFFVAILALMIVGDVLWWLWADARLRRLNVRWGWRVALGTFSGLLLGYLIFFIVFPTQGRHAHHWMPIYPLAGIYIWHIFVLPIALLTILLIGSFSRVGRWVKGRLNFPACPEPEGKRGFPEEKGLSRRRLLAAAAVAAPPLLLGGVVSWSISRLTDYRIRRFILGIPNLPTDLDGLTIAQVTDIHIGRFTRPHMLPRIVEVTNGLKADILAFTGDLIDLAINDLPAGIDMMRRFEPQRAMYMVEGNHDLIEDPWEFETAVRAARLPLLLDQAASIVVRGHPVQILGMTWSRSALSIADSMSKLQRQREEGAFPILLAHHPHAFDAAAAASIPLTLSGHTHGGQIMLNERLGAGPAMFRYWSGLYQKGPHQLIVSNGVGNWFPLRINAPAEIVHITLKRA
jgi:predicted MPP superfamily phosphohydrolase